MREKFLEYFYEYFFIKNESLKCSYLRACRRFSSCEYDGNVVLHEAQTRAQVFINKMEIVFLKIVNFIRKTLGINKVLHKNNKTHISVDCNIEKLKIFLASFPLVGDLNEKEKEMRNEYEEIMKYLKDKNFAKTYKFELLRAKLENGKEVGSYEVMRKIRGSCLFISMLPKSYNGLLVSFKNECKQAAREKIQILHYEQDGLSENGFEKICGIKPDDSKIIVKNTLSGLESEIRDHVEMNIPNS